MLRTIVVLAAGLSLLGAVTAAGGGTTPTRPGTPVSLGGGMSCLQVPQPDSVDIRCHVPNPAGYRITGTATGRYLLGVGLQCGTLPLDPRLGLAARAKNQWVKGTFLVTSNDPFAAEFISSADVCEIEVTFTPTNTTVAHRVDAELMVNGRQAWSLHA